MRIIKNEQDVELLLRTGVFEEELARHVKVLLDNLQLNAGKVVRELQVFEDRGRVMLLEVFGDWKELLAHSPSITMDVLQLIPEWFEVIELDGTLSLPDGVRFLRGYVLQRPFIVQ